MKRMDGDHLYLWTIICIRIIHASSFSSLLHTSRRQLWMAGVAVGISGFQFEIGIVQNTNCANNFSATFKRTLKPSMILLLCLETILLTLGWGWDLWFTFTKSHSPPQLADCLLYWDTVESELRALIRTKIAQSTLAYRDAEQTDVIKYLHVWSISCSQGLFSSNQWLLLKKIQNKKKTKKVQYVNYKAVNRDHL